MFRTFFHGANDYVEMSEGIDRSLLANLGRRRRRRLLAAVSLVLALLVLAPWAASTPSVFQWLSRVAPPVARLLSPSSGSITENGIRLEAAGVTREGDTLQIHLTLEDLEGDRLNDKTYPEHWTYEQNLSTSIGPCTQHFDEETGLLHLFLTCKPAKTMPSFDWERWVTVEITDLLVRTDLSGQQLPIPVTLTDTLSAEPIAAIGENLTVTGMTVSNDKLHVRVEIGQYSKFQDYRLILNGPHGELLHLDRHEDHVDYAVWTFDLRGRDAQACTLTAWLNTTERINGPWRLRVSPIIEE